jgi:hypothetical protein
MKKILILLLACAFSLPTFAHPKKEKKPAVHKVVKHHKKLKGNDLVPVKK